MYTCEKKQWTILMNFKVYSVTTVIFAVLLQHVTALPIWNF